MEKIPLKHMGITKISAIDRASLRKQLNKTAFSDEFSSDMAACTHYLQENKSDSGTYYI